MPKPISKKLLTVALTLIFVDAACGKDNAFVASELPAMHQIYGNGGADRFMDEYGGTAFSAILPFVGVAEDARVGGSLISFGNGRPGGDVACATVDPGLLGLASQHAKGDATYVSGLVAGHLPGPVVLRDCRIGRATKRN